MHPLARERNALLARRHAFAERTNLANPARRTSPTKPAAPWDLPPSPEERAPTVSAHKDEMRRQAALQQLRELPEVTAAAAAAASTVAVSAETSGLGPADGGAQWKALQEEVRRIAASAVGELTEVHARQIERERRGRAKSEPRHRSTGHVPPHVPPLRLGRIGSGGAKCGVAKAPSGGGKKGDAARAPQPQPRTGAEDTPAPPATCNPPANPASEATLAALRERLEQSDTRWRAAEERAAALGDRLERSLDAQSAQEAKTAQLEVQLLTLRGEVMQLHQSLTHRSPPSASSAMLQEQRWWEAPAEAGKADDAFARRLMPPTVAGVADVRQGEEEVARQQGRQEGREERPVLCYQEKDHLEEADEERAEKEEEYKKMFKIHFEQC